jgi:molybdenum cofactor cytidylyltransferase
LTTAVLLAAGKSRRTSGLKQLYRVEGEYLVNLQIRRLRSYGFNVAVVLGYEAETIQKILDKEVTVIFNEMYEEGMFSSVKKAFLHLDSEALLFCHVDRPVPDPAVFHALLHTDAEVAVASYKGRKAPPLYIHASAKNRLLHTSLKRLDHWVSSEEGVAYVEVDDPKVHWNANSDEALKRYFG